MNVVIETDTKVLYLNTDNLAAMSIDKVRDEADQEEGKAILHFMTGTNLTITMPWEALYELRIATNRLIQTKQPDNGKE